MGAKVPKEISADSAERMLLHGVISQTYVVLMAVLIPRGLAFFLLITPRTRSDDFCVLHTSLL